MGTRIGVDIGGTFTDLVVYDSDSGEISVEKVPTTPAAPERGCVAAVQRLLERPGVVPGADYFLHGTTVGLNALLERRGATVGLLCTAGFRDVLEIRRGSRSDAYRLDWTPPEPLVPRHLRLPVDERIDSAGVVVRPLDPATVAAAVATFREHGVSAVGICLMNAYVNPAHELEAERALRAAGFDGEISLSHRLSREYLEYERTSTTAIDAFVRARMADYLAQVERGLRDLGFAGTCLITRSGGGCMSFAETQQRSFETINSGPVAGVEGAAELSRALGLGDLVTADVGGTSFDTALVLGGRPQLLYQGEVAGMPIQAPWVDVRSIGAGGGSIAFVDSGGLLQVGPKSAGAQPGPACYGRGGVEPTVTDAAFLLGMLGQGHLASGVVLDRARAEAALARIAAALDTSPLEAAAGVVRIASSNCANAIREITVEQGIDPRGLAILAFGGAGPLLATQIARELDIARIVVPPFAGNFSAWGLLGSDLVRTTARARRFTLTPEGVGALENLARETFAELLGDDARGTFAGSSHELRVGLRFAGQEHSLAIEVPWTDGRLGWEAAQIERAFRDAYRTTFGIVLDNPVEAIVLRAAVRRPLPRRITAPAPRPAGTSPDLPRQRVYSFATGRQHDAPTFDRAQLEPGREHSGPAVVYEPTCTTYVDADFAFALQPNGCLVLTRKA